MTLQQLQVFIEKFKQKTDLEPNQVYAAFYNVIYFFLNIIRAALGANVNTDNASYELTDRGYYNYIGTSEGNWPLPLGSDTVTGRFYRICNKSPNQSKLYVWGNGSLFFRYGNRTENVELNYGENLTIVFDGTEWTVYN